MTVESNQPILVSIVPNLLGGEGHIIDYHKSVAQAANLLGWEHCVVCVPDAKVKELPDNWYGELRGGDLEAEGNLWEKLTRVRQSLQLGHSIAEFIKGQIATQSRPTIIFLERFIHLQLFSLAIALLLLPRQNISVWILYRRDTHRSKTRWIYKGLNKLIKTLLPPQQFHLLADSEPLGDSLSNYFEKTVTVMPIPHTDITHRDRFPRKNNEIICWWSGPPREEKGWEVIKQLASYSSSLPQKICIVAAQSSKLGECQGSIAIRLVEDNLARSDYLKWMNTCDFILLPYDSVAYRERTSGIFTECIIAGKTPLVTAQTWMAKELSKYDLKELILSWDDLSEIIQKIVFIENNSESRKKLYLMQQEYLALHNLKSYAKTMQEIGRFR
ncbi:glycosyltransferase family 1 protein [Lusitaniella coriacea]|uniref:glycosyltransferase family 1 protein n=1 Tax=Lusitaniella coriacea TaxID=1983105 RepID=UPI003CF02870